MADYHILGADNAGNAHSVVFHVVIPNQDNNVGYNYRTAIVEYQGGTASIDSVVPFIDGTELTQLQSGELWEVQAIFHSRPGESLAEKQARLDVMFSDVSSAEISKLQNVLGFWGHSRVIP